MSAVSPLHTILIVLQSENESHLWSLQRSVWAAETTRRVNYQLHLVGPRGAGSWRLDTLPLGGPPGQLI